MIPYGRHHLEEDDIQAVADVLRHGDLTQGPKIAEFERAIAQYVGARFAVAVSSGTAALHLACLVAELGPGDVVASTPNTFVASTNCACYVGATPRFVDIDPETLNLDPVALARLAETESLSAIIPVHFAGLPCDMPAIHAVARRSGAFVIEDASHALGARHEDGTRVGSCRWSDVTVFSLHPVKILATGEGGLLTTNDEALYRRLLRLRSHGIAKNPEDFVAAGGLDAEGRPNPWHYEMQELGFNYRMTDLQAALGLTQLAKIDRFLARRRQVRARYDEAFADLRFLRTTQKGGVDRSAHHLAVVRIDFAGLGMPRAKFMQELASHGIHTQVHYIPVYRQPYYARFDVRPAAFPEMERYFSEALTLPIYYGLAAEDQELVIARVLDLCR